MIEIFEIVHVFVGIMPVSGEMGGDVGVKSHRPTSSQKLSSTFPTLHQLNNNKIVHLKAFGTQSAVCRYQTLPAQVLTSQGRRAALPISIHDKSSTRSHVDRTSTCA